MSTAVDGFAAGIKSEAEAQAGTAK
jgi:hypothetical protein